MTRSQDLTKQETQIDLSLDQILPLSTSEKIRNTGTDTATPEPACPDTPPPTMIGRYRIVKLLGQGGFGRVFKAYDADLQRDVAIKVPLPHLISSDSIQQKYLEEARTLASLEHPRIVAIHDIGVTNDGLPYMVSAFIEGTDLAMRMCSKPMSLRDAIQIVVQISEALGCMHARGVIHRDIKPGNILLTPSGDPFLSDFGLALREEFAERQRTSIGTPSYMSPEQARGESHLVDGRSDLFSLGVVLYELLTGRRPFQGRDRESVIDKLLRDHPQPVRQLTPSIPEPLDRICMKVLAKRASDRYSNAGDFRRDLLKLLDIASELETGPTTLDLTVERGSSGRSSQSVVPRGLRSFDHHDASWFSRLLPGPRDLSGVPESLRFWERRITPGVTEPPRVGVLYGPSGCGKSSFVKAGLLPLLDDQVTPIFIEATPEDTESRLMRALLRASSEDTADANELVPPASLTELVSRFRRSKARATASRHPKKCLIVIDQFEQWLHGQSGTPNPELASALRQCDGVNVQCLLLVRDDFWLALSRFMSMLEVPLEQNQNATLVDLFDPRHARSVLMELGTAYGRLPASSDELTPSQSLFLDRSVAILGGDLGKIFPVRLALFVEMLKSHIWEIDTLQRLGGIEGIGTQFLEDSFSSSIAPAGQRTHEPAVRQVLRQLLPDQGTDIKGTMQNQETLRACTPYRDRPELFREMVRILDTDLRLITPTDPAGTTSSSESLSQSGDGGRYYQLTHDYLVPAIRHWLTRRQTTSRRGRAELKLAEYARHWSSSRDDKYAPTWLDWLNIRVFTRPSDWNDAEQKMMATATRRHLRSTALFTVAIILCIVTSVVFRRQTQARALVDQLQTARTSELPPLLERIEELQGPCRPLLQNALQSLSRMVSVQPSIKSHYFKLTVTTDES